MPRKDYQHYNMTKEQQIINHLKRDAHRRRQNKTDWSGYIMLTFAALFLAYIIGHLVISL